MKKRLSSLLLAGIVLGSSMGTSVLAMQYSGAKETIRYRFTEKDKEILLEIVNKQVVDHSLGRKMDHGVRLDSIIKILRAMNYPNLNEPLKKNGNDYWSTKKQLEAHFSWNDNIGKFELRKPFTSEQTQIIIDLLGNPEEAFKQKKNCKQVNYTVFYNKLNTTPAIIPHSVLCQKIKNESDKKKKNDSKADTIIEASITKLSKLFEQWRNENTK